MTRDIAHSQQIFEKIRERIVFISMMGQGVSAESHRPEWGLR